MTLQGLFSRFSRLFWLVNTMELFERGAYYGMLAVLPYYLVYTLGFESTAFGVLLGILSPFLYLLPIVSGALVEKYGFRPLLLLSLVLIAAGYLASSMMTSFWAFVLAFIAFGIGVGSFKPIISATIAHSTAPSERNLGYSIYYWMINLGSFSMPIIISLAFPKEQYINVFYLSAGLIGINVALALLLYREPVPPNPQKSLSSVFGGAALVLKDLRFVTLLLIYSGFWFMYATNHLALLLYALDFGVLGDWFPPALVAVVNPGTIILLGPFLGKAFERYESLKVMALGMMIFMAGLLLLGLTTVTAVFFLGIIVFSIGEFITHPTYIAHVSKIAPRDRVTVYMAYAFIPPLIGLTAGNILGGVLYHQLAEALGRPKLFWAVICGVGFVTVALLLHYGRTIGRERPGEEAGTDRSKVALPLGRVFDSALGSAAMVFLVPVLILGAFGGGTDAFLRGTGEDESGGRMVVAEGSTILLTGSSSESTETVHPVELEEGKLVNLTFTLRWTDEADQVRLMRTYENRPDEFALAVTSPNGTSSATGFVANVHGQEGVVSISYSFNATKPGKEMRDGTYEVTVACGACGDFFPAFGVIGFTDTGNDWTLEVSHSYFTRKS